MQSINALQSCRTEIYEVHEANVKHSWQNCFLMKLLFWEVHFIKEELQEFSDFRTAETTTRSVLKKCVITNYTKFTEKNLCQSLFFKNTCQSLFFKNTFFTEHLRTTAPGAAIFKNSFDYCFGHVD